MLMVLLFSISKIKVSNTSQFFESELVGIEEQHDQNEDQHERTTVIPWDVHFKCHRWVPGDVLHRKTIHIQVNLIYSLFLIEGS